MPEITLSGSLADHLFELVDSFNGAVARGVGTSITVSSGFPWGVTMTGSGLFFETSGPGFLRGTVSEFTLSEGLFGATLSEPIRFEERLNITGVQFDAAALFDLVARTSTTISGRFDDAVFNAGLNAQDWTINGGRDADVISGSARLLLNGDDVLRGRSGHDRIEAGFGNDRALGGAGNDWIDGGNGNDQVMGGKGKDVLMGGNGRDSLSGGSGRDVLDGGFGNDQLEGGRGRDVFVFDGGVNEGRDSILDFEAGLDEIHLTRTDADGTLLRPISVGLRLTLESGASVVLFGLSEGDLTVDDLVFL